MKQVLLLCILFSATLTSLRGQNIKNEKIDIKYLQPPYSPLKKELKTFRKSVELVSLSLEDSRESLSKQISSRLLLQGKQYQEVQSGADLELYARLEGYAVEGSRVDSQERSETKSDKTTVTYRVYTGYCNIVYPLFLRLRDVKEDKIIYEGYIDESDRYLQERTSEYRDHTSAKNAVNSLAGEGKKKLFDKNVSSLYGKLVNDYSYFPSSLRWSINYVETSKKMNYDDMVAARDATKAALELLSDNSSEISDSVRQKISGAIEKWQSILKESDIENRKARIDRKVTQAIQENLAYCYFFINNFSEAEKITLQSKEINKQQWQYNLLQSITDMKKRFEANEIKFE
jgi:hypothetical protein